MEKKIYQQSLFDFPFLSTTTQQFSGSDLLQTFNNLGINTGIVSKLTIDALFDTDSQTTKDILEWLCQYPSTENILTPQELEEYEELKDNDELLTDRQYNVELAKILQGYPGILDYEKNVFEVQCMEDEFEILVNQKERLEQVMSLNNAINHKLSRKFAELQEKEIMCSREKIEAQEECVELSECLDKTRQKLQLQIMRYSTHLNDFEYDSRAFISNTPVVKYNQQYEDVTSCLKLFLKQESLLKEHNDNGNFDSLSVLRERITKAFQNFVKFQSEEERLKAGYDFLKNCLSESSVDDLDNSHEMITKANILTYKELLDKSLLKLASVAQKTADAIIDKPETEMLKHSMKAKSEKLTNLIRKYHQIKSVLVNHMLLYSLLKKENNDIQSTDNFFCAVHQHITDNVFNSQLRTKAMTEIINNYYLHEALPMEAKCPLINIIKNLLLDARDENIPVLDVIKNFSNEYQHIEQQVFTNDFIHHRQYCQNLEKDIEDMKRFLCTGPTSQIIVIPLELSNAFDDINQLIETQPGALRKSVHLLNNSVKLLSEKKWVKIRRQLWMFFLMEPKKVIQIIGEIKAHLNQMRNQA